MEGAPSGVLNAGRSGESEGIMMEDKGEEDIEEGGEGGMKHSAGK